MKQSLEIILNELNRSQGIDFRGYRSSTLQRRLTLRMTQLNLTDDSSYLEHFRNDPTEARRLVDVMGVNVSRFFRDALVFELIGHKVLPHILRSKQKTGHKDLRIWSAGCGSGEEAYSLGMLTHQLLEKEGDHFQPYIFASDINSKALATAQQGRYPREKMSETKMGILDSFFSPVDNDFQVISRLKEILQFCHYDLTSTCSAAPSESIYGSFDLILCRNVLIYFGVELQLRVLTKLLHALEPGGYLVLGLAESLPKSLTTHFVAVDESHRIWQKLG